MKRYEFIKTCGFACIGLGGLSLLNSCMAVKLVQVEIENNKLKISRSEFVEIKNGKTVIRRYIIIKSKLYDFPIILYRFSESEFSALLLRCTHQGVELNVNGDLLSCSAHGSEFSNKGELIQGPAEEGLKKYNVTSDKESIYIHLS
jgi:Rieske Fe-S protein